VVVEIGDDLSAGRAHAGVAGTRQSVVFGRDEAAVVAAGDRSAVVGRAVIHDDHLEVRIVEPFQLLEAASERASAVERTDDDRYPRPATAGFEGGVVEGIPHRLQRRLWLPIAIGQT